MVSRVCWYSESTQSTGTPKLISCGWDQSIRLWDIAVASSTSANAAAATASGDSQTPAAKCGEARCIMVGSPLHDLSVAPQGVLVGASDNKVRIYDLRAKGE